MSKIKQTKIPLTISDTEFNWKLVRERDGLTKQSNGIKWLV